MPLSLASDERESQDAYEGAWHYIRDGGYTAETSFSHFHERATIVGQVIKGATD